MKKFSYPKAGGFSLVELMVSVVIGLLAVLFATRIMTDSERNKDAALGGSDSMQNGMVAMFAISGDAEQAGFGLSDPLLMGCRTRFTDSQGYQLPDADGTEPGRLVAARIEPGADGASDTLTLFSGAAFAGSPTLRLMQPYAGGDLSVDIPPTGFRRGDVIAIAPVHLGDHCALTQVGAAPDMAAAVPTLSIGGGADLRFLNADIGTFAAEARVFNLGPARSLSFHTWSAGNGFLRLRATDLDGAGTNPQPVADNIVAFKAQYGFDTRTGKDYKPDYGSPVGQWSAEMIDANGDGEIGNALDYGRVVALRLALVARSKNPERPATDGSCSATTEQPKVFASEQPQGVTAVPVELNLATAGDSVGWQCYHYRVFETIVPLRNASWRP